jgi:YidC/Oxa1 family membrane protein insertase
VKIVATTGIVHDVGSIFQPIFHAVGWMLASLYGLIPNYAVAIILLTIIIMAALTPFTVKSTKSMMAMQRLQPELKKLQQKYKGPENRAQLNEEMMKLYKDEGVNPLGGCLPMLLQAPFLFILYSVIKGLANKTKAGVSQPRYIPKSSKMYYNLTHHFGQIKVFGIDLSLKVLSHHSPWVSAIPFYILAATAVGLQYFQMWQMNNRNKKTGTAVPSQQQMITRFMPLLFAYIYIIIPAAVVLYMCVSTGIRIITQDIMFRMGVSNPHAQKERIIPGKAKQLTVGDDDAGEDVPEPPKPAIPPKATNGNAPRPTNGKKPQPSTPKPPVHPRSKSKRERKDR